MAYSVREKVSAFLAAEAVPIALVALIADIDFVWNLKADLSWTPGLGVMLIPMLIFILLFAMRLPFRQSGGLTEVAFYLALWATFPIFGARLSYLAATANFPMWSDVFAWPETAIGMTWASVHDTLRAHPMIAGALNFAYASYAIQPIVLVCALPFVAPAGRNRELFVAMAIAVIVTVTVSMILPAYGPAQASGVTIQWDQLLAALRVGAEGPFVYTGIVCFPSLHACMAVLFTASMRGNRVGVAIFGTLNALMLIACIPFGDHYIVDILAGIGVAFLALRVAPSMIDRWNLIIHGEQDGYRDYDREDQPFLPRP